MLGNLQSAESLQFPSLPPEISAAPRRPPGPIPFFIHATEFEKSGNNILYSLSMLKVLVMD